jgi:hypothetical protein
MFSSYIIFAGTSSTAATAPNRHMPNAVRTTGNVAKRTEGLKVNPGYSSGSDARDSDKAETDGRDRDISRHSGILALSALRDEMAADGDLAKTLVRIEVSIRIYKDRFYRGLPGRASSFASCEMLLSSTYSFKPLLFTTDTV